MCNNDEEYEGDMSSIDLSSIEKIVRKITCGWQVNGQE